MEKRPTNILLVAKMSREEIEKEYVKIKNKQSTYSTRVRGLIMYKKIMFDKLKPEG